jgi:hypothetical protein
MLEAIKLVGGIAGLVTTAFVIWDRWVRGRPLAWVDATKRFTGTPEEYIRIKNPGYGNVFIRKVRVFPQNIYGVAKDPSVRAITSALFNIDVNVLLRPGKTHDLGIIKSPKKLDEPQDAPSRRVCFLIYWRKTSSTWLPQVPVVIMTSTGDIERIAAAAPKQD